MGEVKSSERHFDWDDGQGMALMEVARAENGDVSISIENPWVGDTESGFGETCSITLPADIAAAFGAWLARLSRATSAEGK